MAKEKTPTDEKFQNQDFDLFKALLAIDNKDYEYYDRLTPEQQKKFVPYMMLIWTSTVKAKPEIQQYYLQSVEYHANKHFFNEQVQKHPKLQWLMLCASSPGIGKQFHQYLPHIKDKVIKLKETAKLKEIVEYFSKVYTNASANDVKAFSEEFVKQQKKKIYIANLYPNLKFVDIEILSNLVTDEQIVEYERELGNS